MNNEQNNYNPSPEGDRANRLPALFTRLVYAIQLEQATGIVENQQGAFKG